MQIFLSLIAALFIGIAVIGLIRRPVTPYSRLWAAVQFLAAGILVAISSRHLENVAVLKPPPVDRKSVTASFNSISVEGSQRQLVFQYTLQNTTVRPFRIDAAPCSMVSFRFIRTKQGQFVPQPNPALRLLEKNSGAYAKFTGLERLTTTSPALSLDRCPLELQPKQIYQVAIAIPYAYPAAATLNPRENDLKKYVRAFMPQIDGFGIADLDRNYEIDFPRGW